MFGEVNTFLSAPFSLSGPAAEKRGLMMLHEAAGRVPSGFCFAGPARLGRFLAPASVSPGSALGVALSLCVPHWASLLSNERPGEGSGRD